MVTLISGGVALQTTDTSVFVSGQTVMSSGCSLQTTDMETFRSQQILIEGGSPLAAAGYTIIDTVIAKPADIKLGRIIRNKQ